MVMSDFQGDKNRAALGFPSTHVLPFSIDGVIRDAFAILNLPSRETSYKYLVNQIWDVVNIFALDHFHDQHNFDTAHLRDDLPAILVHYSRRKVTTSLASKIRRDEINDTIARLHNSNG